MFFYALRRTYCFEHLELATYLTKCSTKKLKSKSLSSILDAIALAKKRESLTFLGANDRKNDPIV